jgi:hypothetical protein
LKIWPLNYLSKTFQRRSNSINRSLFNQKCAQQQRFQRTPLLYLYIKYSQSKHKYRPTTITETVVTYNFRLMRTLFIIQFKRNYLAILHSKVTWESHPKDSEREIAHMDNNSEKSSFKNEEPLCVLFQDRQKPFSNPFYPLMSN